MWVFGVREWPDHLLGEDQSTILRIRNRSCPLCAHRRRPFRYIGAIESRIASYGAHRLMCSRNGTLRRESRRRRKKSLQVVAPQVSRNPILTPKTSVFRPRRQRHLDRLDIRVSIINYADSTIIQTGDERNPNLHHTSLPGGSAENDSKHRKNSGG